MNLIERAFRELYPNREYNYNAFLKYSGKFAPYNANIKLSRLYDIEVKLSKSWKGVDKEIVMGLIQNLLLKIFDRKKKFETNTINIKLYDTFIKNLHIGINKDKINPILKRSFDRINETFFSNQIEIPNLVWGSLSKRKLGCYNFHTDTITISKIFQDQDTELLDYVMYHETLHKFFKFKVNKKNHTYHTAEFRKAEKSYPNQTLFEKRIMNLPLKKKKNLFLTWLTK